MQRYEEATNSHDISTLRPLIATEATFWFTDGSYVGISNVVTAIVRTFESIQDERYTIRNVEWIAVSTDFAVCRYDFEWIGTVSGERKEGGGRATSVIAKTRDQWQVLHEHLSDRAS